MALDVFKPTYKDLNRDEQEDERRAERLATMTPAQTANYWATRVGQDVGKGLGRAAGGLFGVDTRSTGEKYTDAVAKVREEVKGMGFDPDDPESMDQFYRNVIRLLQQQGLVAEAMEVAKEYRAQKVAQQRVDVSAAGVDQRAAAAAGREAVQRDRNQILADIAKAKLDQNQKQFLEKLARDGKIHTQKTNTDLIVFDARTGQELRRIPLGEKPMSEKDRNKEEKADADAQAKYDMVRTALQQQYDAAKELLAHRGLGRATGSMLGAISAMPDPLAPQYAAMLGDDGMAARAVFKRVQGGTFIQALNELKAAGRGSTGLGAVSNVEGDKVQSAKAALSPQQPTAAFKQQLQNYMKDMETVAAELDAAAARDGLQARPLKTGGAVTPPSEPAAPRPAPAAPAAKSTGERRPLASIFGSK